MCAYTYLVSVIARKRAFIKVRVYVYNIPGVLLLFGLKILFDDCFTITIAIIGRVCVYGRRFYRAPRCGGVGGAKGRSRTQ